MNLRIRQADRNDKLGNLLDINGVRINKTVICDITAVLRNGVSWANYRDSQESVKKEITK